MIREYRGINAEVFNERDLYALGPALLSSVTRLVGIYPEIYPGIYPDNFPSLSPGNLPGIKHLTLVIILSQVLHAEAQSHY